MEGFDPGAYADVAPVPLDDCPLPPAPIAFSPQYAAVMGVFRALLSAKEWSRRGLLLSAQAIALNPGAYTAWQYRRQCLAALAAAGSACEEPALTLLAKEFAYTEGIAAANPKNYQLWQHRRWLASFALRAKLERACDHQHGGRTERRCCREHSLLSRATLLDELQFTRAVLTGAAERPPEPSSSPTAHRGTDVEASWFSATDEALRRGGDAPAAACCDRPYSPGASGSTPAHGEEPDVDPKNYHAWAHRQWALDVLAPRSVPFPASAAAAAAAAPDGGEGRTCTCWGELPVTPAPASACAAWPPDVVASELAFTARLLQHEDARNNSAWNHRHFVTSRGLGGDPSLGASVGRGEVHGTLRALRLGPSRNDSAWAYLHGVLRPVLSASDRAADGPVVASLTTAVPEVLAALVALRADAEPGVHCGANELLAALCDVSVRLPPVRAALTQAGVLSGGEELRSVRGALLQELAEADMVRSAFWRSWAATA